VKTRGAEDCKKIHYFNKVPVPKKRYSSINQAGKGGGHRGKVGTIQRALEPEFRKEEARREPAKTEWHLKKPQNRGQGTRRRLARETGVPLVGEPHIPRPGSFGPTVKKGNARGKRGMKMGSAIIGGKRETGKGRIGEEKAAAGGERENGGERKKEGNRVIK